MLNDFKEKYDYINILMSDIIKKSDDFYMKKYFFNQALIIAKQTGKYKLIYDYCVLCKGE